MSWLLLMSKYAITFMKLIIRHNIKSVNGELAPVTF